MIKTQIDSEESNCIIKVDTVDILCKFCYSKLHSYVSWTINLKEEKLCKSNCIDNINYENICMFYRLNFCYII